MPRSRSRAGRVQSAVLEAQIARATNTGTPPTRSKATTSEDQALPEPTVKSPIQQAVCHHAGGFREASADSARAESWPIAPRETRATCTAERETESKGRTRRPNAFWRLLSWPNPQ